MRHVPLDRGEGNKPCICLHSHTHSSSTSKLTEGERGNLGPSGIASPVPHFTIVPTPLNVCAVEQPYYEC